MKIELSPSQKRLLIEALWRYKAHYPTVPCTEKYTEVDNPDYIPLTKAWTGLGNKSTYRPVLDAGLMEWAKGEPRDRHIGWLRLTKLGAKIVQQWLDGGEGVRR